MNINVHYTTKHWSLGLIPIQGSLTSKRITEVVKKRLSEFQLYFDRHIVGVRTDDSSVIIKFGKENCAWNTFYCLRYSVQKTTSKGKGKGGT